MKKTDVRTSEECVMYLAECLLATVSHMQALSRKSKYEFNRQIEIAQYAVDSVKRFAKTFKKTGRLKNVINNYGGSVAKWVEELDAF